MSGVTTARAKLFVLPGLRNLDNPGADYQPAAELTASERDRRMAYTAKPAGGLR
jgi:hypothetical protein